MNELLPSSSKAKSRGQPKAAGDTSQALIECYIVQDTSICRLKADARVNFAFKT